MEMELKTSGSLPAGVTLQGAPKGTETSAVAAEPAKPTPSPGESAKPAGTGSPAEPAKPEKPGRAAAAAKRAERQAAAKAKEADDKTAAAKPVVDQAAKYEEAIKSGDPDKILAAFGMDDEKLVDLYIAKHGTQEAPDGETRSQENKRLADLKAEFDKFKADLVEEKKQEEAKRLEAAARSTVEEHVGGLKAFAAKPENAERFEVCNAEPSVLLSLTGGEYASGAQLAFDVMVAVHKECGEFISYEKALELTEARLLESHKALAGGLGKLKKLGGTPAKVEGKPVAKSEPAAEGDAMAKMRERFKASRPRVTNGLAVMHPSSDPNAKGKAAADVKFRERVLALQRGSAN